MSGPLAGLEVIELAGIGPAPFCAMVLGDLGADVVRIDRPPAPESRDEPTDVSLLTDKILTRSRRSVAIDLKHPDGSATALDLIAAADVLIEGFRPGVMERLGLGPDECMRRNPALVYGRVTGWGQDGPYSHTAGHDINYIALAGALAPIGRRGERPVPPLNVFGDFAGGALILVMGVVAALFEAGRSGEGQVVDAGMVDGSAYLMTMMYELLGRGRWIEGREANPNDGGAPFYDVYETADAKYVAIGAMEPRFYARLLELIGLADVELPEQWDAASWPDLKQRLAGVFRERTRDQWCELLEGTDACFAPVLEMSEAIEHPHNAHRGTFVEVDGRPAPAAAPRFSRTPAGRPGPPPAAGEHTDAVLSERGLAAGRIAELRRAGAIT